MIRRGQIWRYRSALKRRDKTGLWLVVSADSVNSHEDLDAVLALEVFDADPGGLLAVNTSEGLWVTALRIMPIVKTRMEELHDTATEETMDQVSVALRTAQDLHAS